jgi:hypothetical protein
MNIISGLLNSSGKELNIQENIVPSPIESKFAKMGSLPMSESS